MQTELTERELDVMEVLWARSSGTVTEVRRRMPARLAYTTVLTILRTLETKGVVRHEGEGKAHRYFPLVKRGDVVHGAVKRLMGRLFGGSPELLVTHLVSDHKVDDQELRRLRKLLTTRLKGES